MSTPTSSSGEEEEEQEEFRYNTREQHRVAKKSTNAPQQVVPQQKHYETRRHRSKNLGTDNERFLQDFNPETSVREKRKLSRKINPPNGNVRRPPGALYDENGYHINSYMDLCDCLNEECMGCWLPCPKCSSQKCGLDCRVHRKFVYDQIEYHGYDIIVKNPLLKSN